MKNRFTEENEKNYPQIVQKMCCAHRIENQIEKYRDMIKRLESSKYRCTSRLSGMPHGGTKMDLNDILAEIDRINGLITVERKKHIDLMHEIAADGDADRLSMDEYRVLMFRYASGMTVRETADALHMSKTSVWEHEQAAFSKFRTNPDTSGQKK